jgi:hypothetical protein
MPTPEEIRAAKKDDPNLLGNMDNRPVVITNDGFSAEFQAKLDEEHKRNQVGVEQIVDNSGESFGVLSSDAGNIQGDDTGVTFGVLRDPEQGRRDGILSDQPSEGINVPPQKPAPQTPEEFLQGIWDAAGEVGSKRQTPDAEDIAKKIDTILPPTQKIMKGADGRLGIFSGAKSSEGADPETADIIPIGTPVHKNDEKILTDELIAAGHTPTEEGMMRIEDANGMVSYLKMDTTKRPQTAADIEAEKYDRLKDLFDQELRVREDMFRQQKRQMRKIKSMKMAHIDQFMRNNKDPRLKAAALQAQMGVMSDYGKAIQLIDGSRQNMYDGAYKMLQTQFARSNTRSADDQIRIDAARAQQRSALEEQKAGYRLRLDTLKDAMINAGRYVSKDLDNDYRMLSTLMTDSLSPEFKARPVDEQVEVLQKIKSLERDIATAAKIAQKKRAEEEAKAEEGVIKSTGAAPRSKSDGAAPKPDKAEQVEAPYVVGDRVVPKTTDKFPVAPKPEDIPRFPDPTGDPVKDKVITDHRDIVHKRSLLMANTKQRPFSDLSKAVRTSKSPQEFVKNLPDGRFVLVDRANKMQSTSAKADVVADLVQKMRNAGFISGDMKRVYDAMIAKVYSPDSDTGNILEGYAKDGKFVIFSPQLMGTKEEQEALTIDILSGVTTEHERQKYFDQLKAVGL